MRLVEEPVSSTVYKWTGMMFIVRSDKDMPPLQHLSQACTIQLTTQEQNLKFA